MSFDLIFQNAVGLHQAGRLDEAEAAYRRLLEISPENADLLHLLGMIAVQKGAYEAACGYLYKAVRLVPKAVPYRFTLAHALQESGHPKEALEHYKGVLELDASMPETYNNMGIIERRLGHPDAARAYFEKARRTDSSFAPALINIALLERAEGKTAEALALLDEAVRLAPGEAEPYAQKALVLRDSGRPEEAAELYRAALEKDPGNPAFLNGLGITYEALNDTAGAFEAYDAAVRSDSRCADAYNNRANVYARTGRHWEAEADFKTALKIDPKYVEAYNNLGALLYEHERYEEALECYRKAFILNPKQAETSNNLAMAVRAAGDLEEAIGLYFNALVLNPSLDAVRHNLSRALYDLYVHENKPDLAKNLVRKWRDAFPDDAVARHLDDAFQGEAPERASPEYIRALFDAFAETFDRTLENISYRVPDLLRAALKDAPDGLRILDAGCGTGKAAAILKPHARFLAGVDLSERMIARAAEKKLYDALEAADLIPYLEKHPAAFDRAVLADVGCYFGELSPLFRAVYGALDTGGEMIVTLEFSDREGFVLQPSGRFAHSEAFVRAALEEAGFTGAEPVHETLRTEDGKPVAGLFIRARRPFREKRTGYSE